MTATIKNNEITTSSGVKLNEILSIQKVTIEQEYLNTISGITQFVGSTAVIEAKAIDSVINADCELLIDFSELNDDNLVYVMEELTMIMENRGLVK